MIKMPSIVNIATDRKQYTNSEILYLPLIDIKNITKAIKTRSYTATHFYRNKHMAGSY